MGKLRANEKRLWESLMRMAELGATPAGGSRRLALSAEDGAGRDLFVRWCREAGCSVAVDELGNLFARRAGRDSARAPVAAGSHLDTQPHGGKFDGVFGVLAALEVVRTLNDRGIETEAPIEIVTWTNEEGARFAPAMLGSGVFAGAFDREYGLSRVDSKGASVAEALREIGYAGAEACGEHPLACFFEAHIEQGPILENEDKTIGVVTGVQGMRWYDVNLSGQDTHAMTPLELRRDALLAAARMIERVNAIAHDHSPNATSTVGVIRAEPGSRNTVAGEVHFTVDMRHHRDERLDEMEAALHRELGAVAASDGIELSIECIWTSRAVTFHEDCINAVRNSVEDLGHSYRDIVSGAGHDSVYVSRVTPTSMVFIPCAGGLSHNEAESATPSDLAAGCDVLLNAMLERAGVAARPSA